MKTKIATYVLLLPIIILSYYLIMGVKGPIDQASQVKKTEEAIVNKLKFIRDLQTMYVSQKGEYAGKWDKLVEFAKNGQIANVQRREVRVGKDEDKFKIIFDTLGFIPVKDTILKKYPDMDLDKIPFIPGLKDKKFSLYAGKVENGNLFINVFEVKDIYPTDPERGAELNEKGEPYSVPSMLAYFEAKLKEATEKAVAKQKEQKNASSEADKKKIQVEIDDLSKYVNLYTKRIERLKEKPLRVGSREEATLSGNWE